MNYEDLIQQKGFVFLDNIVEPGTNSLRISIKRASISSKSEEVNVGEYTLYDVNPIEIDKTLPVIHIEFDSYVAYSVFDESFHFVIQKINLLVIQYVYSQSLPI